MPKVGGKHFSYGPGGMKAAKVEAEMTGKPIEKMKKPAKKKRRK